MNRRLEKSHAAKDKEVVRLWSLEHEACACCWSTGQGKWPENQTHHIIKSGRAHESCNLLRLCHRCHLLAELNKVPLENGKGHYPKLSLANVLWLKRESDIENFNLERLTELYHSYLPEPEPIPMIFLKERHVSGNSM